MSRTAKSTGARGCTRPSTYLVEHHWPGITPDGFRSATECVRAAADAMAPGGAPFAVVALIVLALTGGPALAELCVVNPGCDDGNPCTVDACEDSDNCSHRNCPPSFNPCRTNNRCVPDFGCVDDPVNCDDGDDCTINDRCDRTFGCLRDPLCTSDGAVCNGLEHCEIVCFPRPFPQTGCFFLPLCVARPPDCNDGLACTIDFCREPGGCGHEAVVCEDSDPCTVGDACVEPSGLCTSTPLDCTDDDLCTEDQCIRGFGCAHTPVTPCCRSAADCPDLPCETQRRCVAGSCTGVPRGCDDGDPATGDTCAPGVGCVHTPEGDVGGGTSCAGAGDCAADQDPCTAAACAAGACVQQSVVGLAGLACTCDRAVPAECVGQDVPRRVTRKGNKACKLIGRMAAAKPARVGKLVRKVMKQYERGQEVALDAGSGDPPKLTPACAQALGATFGDGLARARALEGQP